MVSIGTLPWILLPNKIPCASKHSGYTHAHTHTHQMTESFINIIVRITWSIWCALFSFWIIWHPHHTSIHTTITPTTTFIHTRYTHTRLCATISFHTLTIFDDVIYNSLRKTKRKKKKEVSSSKTVDVCFGSVVFIIIGVCSIFVVFLICVRFCCVFILFSHSNIHICI